MLRAIQDLDEIERRANVTGLTVSAAVLALTLVVGWFAVVMTYQTPPPPEKDFVTVGTIDFTKISAGGKMDFGNNTEGSGSVNNRRAPSPDPGNSRPRLNPPEKAPPPKSAPTPPVEETITQTEEAPVKATPSTPSATGAPISDKPTPRVKKTIDKDALFDEGGGANHGKGNSVGDRGNPRSTTLDPSGLFSFGVGEGEGLNGREVLYCPKPKYSAQEEGKLAFQITISPKGSVIGVKTVKYGGQRMLKQSTEEVLRKWRFSPVSGTKNQTVKVTFTFKLR